MDTEEFPFRDVAIQIPNRETVLQVLDVIDSETMLIKMLSSSTGEEWFFDPNAPLSLRAVEIGDDRMARPFATRALQRDVVAPQIPSDKAGMISVSFCLPQDLDEQVVPYMSDFRTCKTVIVVLLPLNRTSAASVEFGRITISRTTIGSVTTTVVDCQPSLSTKYSN